MPVLRRRIEMELTPAQRSQLATGWVRPGMGGGDHFTTREEFAAAWAEHGPKILADWIAKHPGTRPFGWWLVEHGHERPIVAGCRLDAAEIDGLRSDKFCETLGFLHLRPGGFDDVQQPEREYLAERGLLTPQEMQCQ